MCIDGIIFVFIFKFFGFCYFEFFYYRFGIELMVDRSEWVLDF